MRVPLPVMIFNAGRDSDLCSAGVLAHPDGVTTLFTGEARVKEVRLLNIRAKATVHEPSIGNAAVESCLGRAAQYLGRCDGVAPAWISAARVPKDRRLGYKAGVDMDGDENKDWYDDRKR